MGLVVHKSELTERRNTALVLLLIGITIGTLDA